MGAQQLTTTRRDDRDWITALPLYVASCVVTLTGVGAVGVTISDAAWTPLWATLTMLGHFVSVLLRRQRVPAEPVFYPVMLLGAAVVLQQALLGSSLVGLESGLVGQSLDMATALIVAMLAVLRTFTLVTNTSLLFSPVPAITMLALVGSTNPNAEVPVFFGLAVLGSLFITGYEAHLRRMSRVGRTPGPPSLHLFAAWAYTLIIGGVGLLFPLIAQPVLVEFSPFALPSLNRRWMQNFTQASTNQAPVGQGPITLSPLPVYEVYTNSVGKVRTSVYTRYTGREWRIDRDAAVADVTPSGRVQVLPPSGGALTYELNRFQFPSQGVVGARIVQEAFVTQARGQTMIPSSGSIVELRYPGRRTYRHNTGSMSGNAHQMPGKLFEVTSEVREYSAEELRAAPALVPQQFAEPETLELPNSAYRVTELAKQITQDIPNPYDRVQAIIHYIETNCSYTLQEEVTPQGEDAAAHYLFSSKRGACDLAATATAVMCRSVGIPARAVVGFVLEEPLPQGGGFLVRQAHSHMWVEAYFPTRGWVPFDPAPPISSIRENPLTAAWYRLTSAFSKIGGGGLDAVLLVIVVFTSVAMAVYAGMTWFRLRVFEPARLRRELARQPGGTVLLIYERALRLLLGRGWRRERWMTAREYAQWLQECWVDEPKALEAAWELTTLFERVRYAGEIDGDAERRALAALESLKQLAPTASRAGGAVPEPEGTG